MYVILLFVEFLTDDEGDVYFDAYGIPAEFSDHVIVHVKKSHEETKELSASKSIQKMLQNLVSRLPNYFSFWTKTSVSEKLQ